MTCTNCGSQKTRVYGTRKGFTNVRFRECVVCKHKFMTKEVPMEDLITHEYNNYLEEIGELEHEVRQKALKES